MRLTVSTVRPSHRKIAAREIERQHRTALAHLAGELFGEIEKSVRHLFRRIHAPSNVAWRVSAHQRLKRRFCRKHRVGRRVEKLDFRVGQRLDRPVAVMPRLMRNRPAGTDDVGDLPAAIGDR